MRNRKNLCDSALPGWNMCEEYIGIALSLLTSKHHQDPKQKSKIIDFYKLNNMNWSSGFKFLDNNPTLCFSRKMLGRPHIWVPHDVASEVYMPCYLPHHVLFKHVQKCSLSSIITLFFSDLSDIITLEYAKLYLICIPHRCCGQQSPGSVYIFPWDGACSLLIVS